MGLRISAAILGGFSDRRVNAARDRINLQIPATLTRIARDAEKMLKTDYLKRGGTFTRTKNAGRSSGFGRPAKTKTSGYAWVKNPGQWLRWGTGNLARSWIHVVAQKVPGGWQSRIFSRGNNVPYARIHEFGGVIRMRPRTFLRGIRGKNAGAIRRGKTSSGWTVTIPKRPYLQPMIEDNLDKWRGWVKDDLRAAFK